MLLCDSLVEMRVRSGKTQKNIASHIKVSLRTWQNYENGSSDISVIRLFKASMYCRYDIMGVLNNFTQRTTVIKGYDNKKNEKPTSEVRSLKKR